MSTYDLILNLFKRLISIYKKITEDKKYNPFVVIKPKSKPKPKPMVRPKAKIKLEAGGLSLENKKKLDIIYARGFVKTSKK